MEINEYEKIIGVVPTADVVEGLMGLLTSHTWDNDFGSDTDLPGFKVPATADEAKSARYMITWRVNNMQFPAPLAYPAVSFSLRQGFDHASNFPVALTLYGTNPAAQNCLTIPSGYKSLAFNEGRFTVPSCAYIYNAAFLTPGSPLEVANTAEDGADAGKLKYLAVYEADRTVGRVYHYDATTALLTVVLD